jgi:hypothetical protein
MSVGQAMGSDSQENDTLRIPMTDKAVNEPGARIDNQSCKIRHLEALSDFIETCHSKAGARNMPPPPTLTLLSHPPTRLLMQ